MINSRAKNKKNLINLNFILKDSDYEEEVYLKRRQMQEEERKKRIFDTKFRTIGVDKAGLDKQIQEKEFIQSRQKEWERLMDEQMQRQQEAVYSVAKEEEKQKRLIHDDLNYYRNHLQRPDMSRDYDLNDPNTLKKDKPLRGDPDVEQQLGISSAQIFEGEDLSEHDRLKRQREQQRAWLDQQILERQRAKDACKDANNYLDNSAFLLDRCLTEVATKQQKLRNEIDSDIRRYNMEMAKLKAHQKELLKRETEEDNLAEIYNMLSSDILTENTYTAQSCVDSNRVIPSMYRGMTRDQLRKFHEEQYKVLLDKQKLKSIELMNEKKWEDYMIQVDYDLKAKEIELNRKQKNLFKEHMEYNEELKIVQNELKEKTNKDLQKNKIEKEFFDKFNQSSR